MSRRLEQVNSKILQDVAAIIRRDLEFKPGVIASVVKVRVEPDLKSAAIYVSVLPETAAAGVLKYLAANRVPIQQQLAKGLTMKFLPKIRFLLDDTESQAARIESLIDSLN